METTEVLCIGGGPAGLTAAYLLCRAGKPVTVVEADPTYLGGISRTAQYKGFRFDIGGHRFFSKSKEVEDLWSELLPNDLLDRPRSSRIFYGGKFYSYPLKAFEALSNLGLLESALCMLSYGKARMSPVKDARTFEDWVSNQFGRRLFSIFFKTYTEKVWGMPCREISADWAAQRIKGLSLGSAVKNALFPPKKKSGDRSQVIKTLIDSFRYPRLGPGMMWDAAGKQITAQGGTIRMGTKVVAIERKEEHWQVLARDQKGQETRYQAKHVISSAPLRELVEGIKIEPALAGAARRAATSLRYRDFLTVALILKDRDVFQDNWIYIHDPKVKVGRIQNFKSWSPEMVPDASKNCLGLEYFCFEGDGMWSMPDAELIRLAGRELIQLGLAIEEDILDGCVVRQPKAYPVYDDAYQDHLKAIRAELDVRCPNLHLVGRNGMHKYNNQDHAMMTAMLTARNILAGKAQYDVWAVNEDAEYHESGSAAERVSLEGGLRLVPGRAK